MGCAASKTDNKKIKIQSSHNIQTLIKPSKAYPLCIRVQQDKFNPLSPQLRTFVGRTIILEKDIMSSSIMLRRMQTAQSGNLQNQIRS